MESNHLRRCYINIILEIAIFTLEALQLGGGWNTRNLFKKNDVKLFNALRLSTSHSR